LPKKTGNGSSNHGEPFFLKPHPSPLQRRGRKKASPDLSKGEEKEKERMKGKIK
jgi:hypothetical protein